jgi:hypothetical protein
MRLFLSILFFLSVDASITFLNKQFGAEERREIKNIYYAASFTNPTSDPTKINSTRTETFE